MFFFSPVNGCALAHCLLVLASCPLPLVVAFDSCPLPLATCPLPLVLAPCPLPARFFPLPLSLAPCRCLFLPLPLRFCYSLKKCCLGSHAGVIRFTWCSRDWARPFETTWVGIHWQYVIPNEIMFLFSLADFRLDSPSVQICVLRTRRYMCIYMLHTMKACWTIVVPPCCL